MEIFKSSSTIVKFFILLTFFGLCEGKRILLVSYPMPSHNNELKMIGEKLIKGGHEVYGLIPPTYPGLEELQSKTPVKYLTYEAKSPDMYSMPGSEEMNQEWLIGALSRTFLEDIVYSVDPEFPNMAFCDNPLSDEVLFQKLKSLNIDLAIMDAFSLTRCLYILPYKLDIPYVSVTTQYEPWLQRNPALPSFVPFPVGTGDFGYTEKMTFWQRLYNTYIMAWASTLLDVDFLSDDLVRKYAPEKPFCTLTHLTQQSLVWLMDTDVIIDYARPSMPNMVEVGGLTTKPPQPLEKDLEEFVQGAEQGIIVISFGSLGTNLPPQMSTKIMDAVKQVKYRVVWGFPLNPPDVIPSNVKLLPWIPQNDLLGHPKTKLFITHCGANGQFEALYNAVPMIAFPLFGDQMYNAKRGEYFGIGIQMDLLTFTTEELVTNIHKVIAGDYSKTIKVLSDIFRDRPFTPAQRAVYWVEHVLKFGGQYLHSHAVDMPWYEYLMLDIMAFGLAVLILALLACVCSVRFLCKFLWKSHPKEKQN